MKIHFIKLHPKAFAPSRTNVNDAGADLYAVENTSIPPLCRKLVKTGIAISMPDGIYGRIAPRSGLALKYGLDVLAGVIDPGYRGEIGVILYNTDQNSSFNINAGDRVAQIIFETCHIASFEETNILDNSIRSDGGFGSSGK